MRIDTLGWTDRNAAEIKQDFIHRYTRLPEKEKVPGFMEKYGSEHRKGGSLTGAAEFPPQREYPKESRPEFPANPTTICLKPNHEPSSISASAG